MIFCVDLCKQEKQVVIKAAQDDAVKSFMDLTSSDVEQTSSVKKTLPSSPPTASTQLLSSPQKITLHFATPSTSMPFGELPCSPITTPSSAEIPFQGLISTPLSSRSLASSSGQEPIAGTIFILILIFFQLLRVNYAKS